MKIEPLHRSHRFRGPLVDFVGPLTLRGELLRINDGRADVSTHVVARGRTVQGAVQVWHGKDDQVLHLVAPEHDLRPSVIDALAAHLPQWLVYPTAWVTIGQVGIWYDWGWWPTGAVDRRGRRHISYVEPVARTVDDLCERLFHGS